MNVFGVPGHGVSAEEALPKSRLASSRQHASGPQRLVLGLVELGQSPQLVRPRLRQVTLGLDILQHHAHSEVFALPRELERLLRGSQRSSGDGDLLGQGAEPFRRGDDFGNDCVS